MGSGEVGFHVEQSHWPGGVRSMTWGMETAQSKVGSNGVSRAHAGVLCAFRIRRTDQGSDHIELIRARISSAREERNNYG